MRYFLATLAAIALATPAFAVDLSAAPPPPLAPPLVAPNFNWAGPYVGVFAGWGWGNVDVTDVDGYNRGGGFGDFSYAADGFTGGFLAGNNWQSGAFVAGVEGELGYLGLDGTAQFPPYAGVRGPDDSRSTLSTDFCGALTGRAGFAAGNVLFYGKAGLSGVHADASFIDTDPTGTTLVSGTSASKFLLG
jgi:outer membrane immunogenic protein